MVKQPHITEATKQAFIDAFCEMCETVPIEKITIQALTQRAGYNRCTFYAYFNNINNLMEHIEDEVISFAKSNVFETIESVGVADKFISMFTKDVQEIQERYIDILMTNSAHTGFTMRLKEALLPAFMQQFNVSDDDLKSRYTLDFHISGMISIMTSWVSNGRDIPAEKLGEVVRGVLAKGVLDVLGDTRRRR